MSIWYPRIIGTVGALWIGHALLHGYITQTCLTARAATLPGLRQAKGVESYEQIRVIRFDQHFAVRMDRWPL